MNVPKYASIEEKPAYYLCSMTLALQIQKKLWVAAGFLLSAIGIVGYIVPMMPGLVFFILAAFCFAKGSRKFLRKLIGNKHIGPQIMDWKRGKGMSMKTKILAISMIIPSMTFSAFYMVELQWVRWIIMISLIGIVMYILNVKTKKSGALN